MTTPEEWKEKSSEEILQDIERCMEGLWSSYAVQPTSILISTTMFRRIVTICARDKGLPIGQHKIARGMRARKRALMHSWHPFVIARPTELDQLEVSELRV